MSSEIGMVITAFVVAIKIIFILSVWSWLDKSLDATFNDDLEPSEKIEIVVTEHPVVKEGLDMADACDRSQAECLMKIGEKAVTEKLGSYSKTGGDE